ncbi:MAG: DUF3105 domain-containing protein [Roseiflexaceae bacterium]|nr:DUF3105 domain-containing protein [Roseiflexaceae bacterium]
MSQERVRESVSGRQLRKRQGDRSTYVMVGSIVGVVILAIVGVLIYSLSRPAVQQFADLGSGQASHLDQPDSPLPEPWNSSPPTSGWHWGGGATDPGLKDVMIADSITVHNLEHGFVVFHYREDLDSASVERIRQLTLELQQLNPCIVTQPRPVDQLDVPVAATAWTYLLKLDSYDEQALRSFFADHVGKDGPEQICPVGVQ